MRTTGLSPIWAPERPFRTKGGRDFARDGPSSREARPEEVKRVLLSGPNRYFDGEPVVDATRDDLGDLSKCLLNLLAEPQIAPPSMAEVVAAVDDAQRPRLGGAGDLAGALLECLDAFSTRQKGRNVSPSFRERLRVTTGAAAVTS